MMNNNYRFLYLDLLKKSLSRSIFPDCYAHIPKNTRTLFRTIRSIIYVVLMKIFARFSLELVSKKGRIGETMMGMGALDNLEMCITEVFRENIPGDLCETGVWRGGGCIFMQGMCKVYDETHRNIWVCDSFEGLPKPNPDLYPADANDQLWKQELGVSVQEVKENFEKYNLLDNNVKFVKGFFSETMQTIPIQNLAVLRLDGDMYESTFVVLEYLYPKLSIGGYVIFDDYGMIEGCDMAIDDFRRQQNITEPIHVIGFVHGKP
ncbi:MAG: TylF/MycF/NovP-related O-methyltransferase, partial [Dolichospermum sp.]